MPDLASRSQQSTAMTATFSSFGVKNFRLFFSGQMVSQVGSWLRMIAQALLVLELTDSGVAVGLVTACQFGPLLLLGPWFGLIIDRSDKRKLLIVVQVTSMTISLAFAALAFLPHPPLAGIYALALAGGVAVAIDNPARRAFISELVPAHLAQNAMSLNGAMLSLARIVGPALAGLLISTVGYGWCFVGDSLSFIAVITGFLRMDVSQLRPSPVTERGRRQIREGMRYFRSVPELWAGLVMMAIIGTLAFNFQVVLPLFVTRTLDGTNVDFTLMYSSLSLGSLVGALLMAAPLATIELAHVVASALAFGVSMLVFAVMPSTMTAFVTATLVGAASMIFMTASASLLQLHADPAMRGRGLALQAMVFLGSAPVGGPVVGAICERFGARAGLAVGGVSCVAAALWGMYRVRLARPAPTSPTPT